ncbi:MAG: protein translocase subunit SecDF, partial [Chitinophagaceae bacterium]
GMNVVMEVSLEGLIRSMSNNSPDPALNKALDMATQEKANSAADYITLFGQAWEKLKPANERLAPLFANAFEKQITFNSTDQQVLNAIRVESRSAIKRTYNVLQQRIDKFGVSQPEINLDLDKGIISVALAGIHNPQRVNNYLQATAKLEFWEVFESNQDFANNVLKPMDEAVANYLASSTTKSATAADTTKKPVESQKEVSSSDTTGLGALATLVNKNHQAQDTGTSGALNNLTNKNPLESLLHQPQQYGAMASISMADTALWDRYIQIPAVRNAMPRNLKFLYGQVQKDPNTGIASKFIDIYAIKMPPGSDKPLLGGEHVVDARQDIDQNGRAEISMTMDNVGAKIWAKMTAANVHKPIAIVLDNVVYSAPAPTEEISGGRSSITGNFTIQQAQDLANILKVGKLPAPAHIVQEQIIGPTLGHESIIAGAKSFIISFILIFIMMLIYYNSAGWVANIALIFNLLFTVGVLAALGATLTMPGIAGLILAIGMAVDSNVIVFERIKEELVRGKGYFQAISDGYKHSYAPVLDGHITTLLTAIILFYFGLGAVKGFATTQILGLLLSLFCGLLISRMIEDYWTKKNRHFTYFTKLSKAIFRHAQFDFVKARRYTYFISGIVVIFGISSFFHGFNEGVEFSGGRSYTVRFDKPVSVEKIRETLKPYFGDYPVVKTVDEANQANITTAYLIHETGNNVDSLVESKLFEGLHDFLPAGTNYSTFDKRYKMSSQTVLPTISQDLKKGAVKAVIVALIVIFAYILLRFRRWQFSVGTILSLIHDSLVIIAVFSFLKNLVPFPMEINQDFIAAILTVIGYSMNDTVIVFDRIREYFHTLKGVDRNTVINKAINDTLSRTIMTSVAVFITLLVLFIFGGASTRGFAFAMLIGVITGTYSSIFVAAPVLVDFDRKNKLVTVEEAKAQAKQARLEEAIAKK